MGRVGFLTPNRRAFFGFRGGILDFHIKSLKFTYKFFSIFFLVQSPVSDLYLYPDGRETPTPLFFVVRGGA